jgi:hypothetical protein
MAHPYFSPIQMMSYNDLSFPIQGGCHHGIPLLFSYGLLKQIDRSCTGTPSFCLSFTHPRGGRGAHLFPSKGGAMMAPPYFFPIGILS